MPPRRSARVAAVIERATTALAPLPHALVLLIFSLLPVDVRARCACVCRGWRAVLREGSLWTRLDVSRTSGVALAVSDALLRGAAARAGGGLQTLDVSGSDEVSGEALLAVATANAGALRELRICHGVNVLVNRAPPDTLQVDAAEALLRAVPQLRVLDADVHCGSVADARRALRAEGLLLALRIHALRVRGHGAAEADVLALPADVAAHAWLQELLLIGVVQTPAWLDAVVDTALERRLTALAFAQCGLNSESAPALARLLGGSALTHLRVTGTGHTTEPPLLDAPAAALLAGALRANTTLTSLNLQAVRFWNDAAAAITLLGALTAHPSLRVLILSFNEVHEPDTAAAGAALGALLAANAPALTELDVAICMLGDAGMGPLFEALPHNTHLRTLRCVRNDSTEVFAHDVLLPAARANTSLRELDADDTMWSSLEAMRLVRDRA
jgi:hypothetical protein